MSSLGKKEAVILFCGDIFFFTLSLWLALYVRFWEIPTWVRFQDHLVPFSLLFIAWILVYFIAGLYEKHTLLLKSKLPNVIFNAQIINSAIAIVFFYITPYVGIAPKTILFIYIFISFIFILGWRSVLGLR
jgi:FlaA1/EpsC-like NDP-sugar epimerase